MYKLNRIMRLTGEIKELKKQVLEKTEEIRAMLYEEPKKRKPYMTKRRKLSLGSSKAWANKNPEQKAEWIAKIQAGRKKRFGAEPNPSICLETADVI